MSEEKIRVRGGIKDLELLERLEQLEKPLK